MSKKTKTLVGAGIGILLIILIISVIVMRTNSNIDTSNLEKLGTFVTLEQEDDGRYYGVDFSGYSKRGAKVYEFSNGYLLEKDEDNLNIKDSYSISVIDESTFVVTDEDEFEDTTLTIVSYDSSTGVLELNEGGDIIYCYPYDKVDLENTTEEHDPMYFYHKYYVNLK
ncbi:MAG: hypothetical protein ACLUFN_10305 [Eubacterium sp.]